MYVRTYMHACMHAYTHTCIHAYIHSYIRTYIHMFVPIEVTCLCDSLCLHCGCALQLCLLSLSHSFLFFLLTFEV